jgi:hypothetical protein
MARHALVDCSPARMHSASSIWSAVDPRRRGPHGHLAAALPARSRTLLVSTSLDALVGNETRPAVDIQALRLRLLHMIRPRTIYAGVRALRRAGLLSVERDHADATYRVRRGRRTWPIRRQPITTRELLSRQSRVRCLQLPCFRAAARQFQRGRDGGEAPRPKPMQAYSIGFDEPAYDEAEFARAATEAFRLDWHRHQLTPTTALTLPGCSRLRSAFGNSSRSPSPLRTRGAQRRCGTCSPGTAATILLALAMQTTVERFAGWPAWLRTGRWLR